MKVVMNSTATTSSSSSLQPPPASPTKAMKQPSSCVSRDDTDMTAKTTGTTLELPPSPPETPPPPSKTSHHDHFSNNSKKVDAAADAADAVATTTDSTFGVTNDDDVVDLEEGGGGVGGGRSTTRVKDDVVEAAAGNFSAAVGTANVGTIATKTTTPTTTTTTTTTLGNSNSTAKSSSTTLFASSLSSPSSPFVTHVNGDGTFTTTTTTVAGCVGVGGGGGLAVKKTFSDDARNKLRMAAEKAKNDGDHDDDDDDGRFDITFDCNQDGFDDLTKQIDEAVANSKRRDNFWVWMVIMFMTFVGLLVYGFMSGLFLGGSSNDSPGADADATSSGGVDLVERQQYFEDLLRYFDFPILEPSSPQAQAMEWLAFEDTMFDLSNNNNNNNNIGSRLHQRYALASWYFDQGGPKFWTKVNRDENAGWIVHGTGVHECDWTGIDCQEQSVDGSSTFNEDNNEEEEEEEGKGEGKGLTEKVVVGVRLRPSFGIILTGTSLTPEFGMLTNLRRLEAADQRLGGSIPDEWRTLTNLGTVATRQSW